MTSGRRRGGVDTTLNVGPTLDKPFVSGTAGTPRARETGGPHTLSGGVMKPQVGPAREAFERASEARRRDVHSADGAAPLTGRPAPDRPVSCAACIRLLDRHVEQEPSPPELGLL